MICVATEFIPWHLRGWRCLRVGGACGLAVLAGWRWRRAIQYASGNFYLVPEGGLDLCSQGIYSLATARLVVLAGWWCLRVGGACGLAVLAGWRWLRVGGGSGLAVAKQILLHLKKNP